MATASLRYIGGGQAAEKASKTATGESNSKRRLRPADSDPCGVVLLNWERGTNGGSTLRDARTTSWGSLVTSTDRRGTGTGVLIKGLTIPRSARQRGKKSPLPSPSTCCRQHGIGEWRVASPGFPPPSSPARGHTHREGRLQAQRQRAEPEPERRTSHAAQTGGGSSAGYVGPSCGLHGAPGRLC